MYIRVVLTCTLLLTQLFLASCRENSEDQPPGNNGGTVPAGLTRIYGEVRDPAAQPLSGVALHVVYEVGTTGSTQGVETPSSTAFYWDGAPLTTECNSSTPIPDGVMVRIFWDNDANGPDVDDPQPPLCAHPPDCMDGPSFTVNQIEFAMNGSENWGLGTFYMSRYFVISEALSPNIFFLRIYCSDGNILWESDAMNVPAGASETRVPGWDCDSCNGIPANPQWALDPSYPNPAADSVWIRFGLQETAVALLTLEEAGTGRLDTLVHQSYSSGSYLLPFSLEAYPNGLYAYRFRAGTYSSEGTLLKNTEGAALPSAPALTTTGSAGEFRFDTAAEVNINLRSETNQNQGIAFLDHMHLFAIKPGYVTLDTLLTVASEESLRVDITMIPQ